MAIDREVDRDSGVVENEADYVVDSPAPQPFVSFGSKKMLPKISIITPSFNQGEYLEETILSVLDQNYPNLEYIIMDGGSSDLSSLIIDRYRDRLSFVRLGPDKGQYHAIQEGIDRSSGELIAWINSDDKHHEGALFRMAAAATMFPEYGWFSGLPTVWNQFGRLQYVNTSPPEWTAPYLTQLPDDPAPWYIQQESTFFRRSIWEKAGASFDLSLDLAADFELWLRFTKIQQIRQLNTLIGGFRIQPNQRSHVQRTGYIREVRAAIERNADLPISAAPEDSRPSTPTSQALPYLHKLERNFVLATSIAPHRQYAQYKAVQTWLDAGFRVLSFNEPEEIKQLKENFPTIEFISVKKTARDIVGKPLVFIKDVLEYFDKKGFDRCGIVNSDISFINTIGIMDACSLHLKSHDAIFASRIEVQQPLRQTSAFNASIGRPTIKFGPIYIWGFDLFLLSGAAVKAINASMDANSPFAFGVPWWDYLVPSLAMKLKLNTAILHPPPISHPTHAANYDWRLWQMYGHIYLHTLGLQATSPDLNAFVPAVSDLRLQDVSQQFVQMLIRGSEKIDLGSLIHAADSMPVNLGYGDLSQDVVRQLSVGNAYGAEPFLNLAGYLRDQFALSESRRDGVEFLKQRGISYGG